MTNLEKWKYLLKDIMSPESFIEMGFYWMIAAALQRRVWLGHEERALFPNMYMLLVGKPGVGKNLVINPIEKILTYYKFKGKESEKNGEMSEESVRDLVLAIQENMYKQNLEDLIGHKKAQKEQKANLFPVSADSTTYEALVEDLTLSARYHIPTSPEQKAYKFIHKGKYKHCSLSVLLEEASTLFRKNMHDIVTMLIKGFDCGNHTHKTKTQGSHFVERMCLNILAGTTPDFVHDTFSSKLLTEGFASRTICVFEEAPRFVKFNMGDFNEDQIRFKAELIVYIKRLYHVFGRVEYTRKAYKFLEDYVERVLPIYQKNPSSKLESYYARKPVHLQKLAMAIAFSESLEMEIPLSACEKAVTILDKLEGKMDRALAIKGRNVTGGISDKILNHIARVGPRSEFELLKEFISEVDRDELNKALDFLVEGEKLEKMQEEKDNGKRIKKYKIRFTN